jgi:hypothetical protein
MDGVGQFHVFSVQGSEAASQTRGQSGRRLIALAPAATTIVPSTGRGGAAVDLNQSSGVPRQGASIRRLAPPTPGQLRSRLIELTERPAVGLPPIFAGDNSNRLASDREINERLTQCFGKDSLIETLGDSTTRYVLARLLVSVPSWGDVSYLAFNHEAVQGLVAKLPPSEVDTLFQDIEKGEASIEPPQVSPSQLQDQLSELMTKPEASYAQAPLFAGAASFELATVEEMDRRLTMHFGADSSMQILEPAVKSDVILELLENAPPRLRNAVFANESVQYQIRSLPRSELQDFVYLFGGNDRYLQQCETSEVNKHVVLTLSRMLIPVFDGSPEVFMRMSALCDRVPAADKQEAKLALAAESAPMPHFPFAAHQLIASVQNEEPVFRTNVLRQVAFSGRNRLEDPAHPMTWPQWAPVVDRLRNAGLPQGLQELVDEQLPRPDAAAVRRH